MSTQSQTKTPVRSIPLLHLLQTRLILFFLAISIIPLVFVSWWTFTRSQNALSAQINDRLVAVRNLKAERLEAFLTSLETSLNVDANSPVIVDALQHFSSAEDFYSIRLAYLWDSTLLDAGQGTIYDKYHAQYHSIFGSMLNTKGYADMYLVAPDGTIVYNFDKGDDFATNLLSGPYKDTHLAALFRELRTSTDAEEVKITDFVPYGPSHGIPASFIGSPIIANGENIGVLIYQLNLAYLNDILQKEAEVIGMTGEVYLVGTDKLMRSDLRFSEESTILKQEIDNQAVRSALDGKTSTGQITNYNGELVLVAYQPLKFGTQTWALVTQVDAAEAATPANLLSSSILFFSGVVALLVTIIGIIITRRIIKPISELTMAAAAIAEGDINRPVPVTTRDEIGLLAQAFGTMTERLRDLLSSLEQQIADRTRALEQRSAYLESSAEISRAATSILDTDTLIRQVVQLIKERFNLYYVGLFLVDERNEWAILQAGTGEAGQKMLASNHRLKIGEGMIGWSIANAEARIALDVGEDAVRFENPYLPETRSEGALPLRSRGRVLGALTVQSAEESAFDQDILTTLQTMADQVAVALDNAELFAKSEAALEAERKAYGALSQEAWKEIVRGQTISGYISNAPGMAYPIQDQQTLPSLHTIDQTIQDEGLSAVIPIKSHGRILGGIKLGKLEGSKEWTQDQLALIQTVSEQMSVALESARLYQETQRRATRERVIAQVSTHIRETLDIQTILETTVDELYERLGLETAAIHLATEIVQSEEE